MNNSIRHGLTIPHLLFFGVLLLAGVMQSRKAEAQEELVTRNRVGITLQAARRILEAAESKAGEMNVRVNISVVDDGGHPVAFARMNGARPGSAYTAMTKAVSAATMQQATGPFPPGTQTPDPLLNLAIQLTAMSGGGKVTTLYGGVPIVIDGQIAGAVGVGGATGEQDAEIARTAIESLLQAIGENGK